MNNKEKLLLLIFSTLIIGCAETIEAEGSNPKEEIKEKLKPLYKDYPNILESLNKEQDVEEFVKTIEYCQDLDKNGFSKREGHDLFALHPELEEHYLKAKRETNY